MESRFSELNRSLDLAASQAPYKTIEYYQAVDQKSGIQARKESVGLLIGQVVAKPKRWETNPIDSFYLSAAEPSQSDLSEYQETSSDSGSA